MKGLIVGCGKIAGGFDDPASVSACAKTHVSAMKKNGAFSSISCMDIDLDRARSFSERWKLGSAYSSFEEVDVGEFEFISICTPTSNHTESVLQSIRLNPKAIFVEKPLSDCASRSNDLINECEKAGVSLVVNYSRRWDASVQKLSRDISDGSLGELRSISGWYNKGIHNNGSHLLDILLEMFGPLEVIASVISTQSKSSSDPDIDGILRTKGGVNIHIATTDAEDYSLFELKILTSEMEIIMLDGGLRWGERKIKQSDEYSGYKRLGEIHYRDGEYLPVMEKAVQSVTEVINSEATDCSSAVAALQTQKLCEEMVRYANGGF